MTSHSHCTDTTIDSNPESSFIIVKHTPQVAGLRETYEVTYRSGSRFGSAKVFRTLTGAQKALATFGRI